MSIWKNIRLRGLKDVLSWSRIKLYFRGKKRAAEGTLLQIAKYETLVVTNDKLQSFIEQVVYRQSFPECQKCLEKGECIHCGCKSPELFYDEQMVCSGGNWQEMKSPQDWEEYKKDIGIEITAVQK